MDTTGSIDIYRMIQIIKNVTHLQVGFLSYNDLPR
jgi:hypothetical protein